MARKSLSANNFFHFPRSYKTTA